MKPRASVVVLIAAVLAASFAARSAAAFSRPTLDVGLGTSFGADSRPTGGGATVSVATTWPVLDRFHFGAQLFAVDVGTSLDRLRDPHDLTDLGTVASRHRWTWGGSWVGEADLFHARRWSFGAGAALGWWRVEDDQRGSTVAAASAVGTSVGIDARRIATGPHQVGLSLRFHKLYKGQHPGFDRVGHLGTAAITWRWAGPPRP